MSSFSSTQHDAAPSPSVNRQRLPSPHPTTCPKGLVFFFFFWRGHSHWIILQLPNLLAQLSRFLFASPLFSFLCVFVFDIIGSALQEAVSCNQPAFSWEKKSTVLIPRYGNSRTCPRAFVLFHLVHVCASCFVWQHYLLGVLSIQRWALYAPKYHHLIANRIFSLSIDLDYLGAQTTCQVDVGGAPLP